MQIKMQLVVVAVISGYFKEAVVVGLAFKEIGVKVIPQILGASFPNKIGSLQQGVQQFTLPNAAAGVHLTDKCPEKYSVE